MSGSSSPSQQRPVPAPEGAPAQAPQSILALALGLGLGLLAMFVGLGATPLIDLDEGAFSAATTEMLLRSEFLSTYLAGQPRYDKPILIYWMQAASVSVLGFNELAFRLPSALMGAVWVLLAFWFAQRLWGSEGGYRVALLAATVTACTLGVAFIARLAMADALLNACMAAAVFAQYLWLRQGQRRSDLWLAWGAMAVGVLAKGPIAVVVPLAALLLHCASLGQWRSFWVFVTRWHAISLFLLIALPWYAAVTWVEGPTFVLDFLLHHNVGRFTGGMGDQHSYGLLYYVPVLLIITLPFTGVLLAALARARTLWREDDFARYALLLLGFVFLFFSLSANKLPHYLLYGISAALVLLAREMVAMRSRWLLLPALLLFALLLAFPSLLAWARDRSNLYYQTLLADIDVHFGVSYAAVYGLMLVAVLVFMWERRLQVSTKLIASGLMSAYALALVFLPALGTTLQEPIKKAGLIARDIDAPLVMYGFNTPSVAVYAQRIVPRRMPVAGEMAITQVHHLERMPPHEVLFQERHTVLIRVLTP